MDSKYALVCSFIACSYSQVSCSGPCGPLVQPSSERLVHATSRRPDVLSAILVPSLDKVYVGAAAGFSTRRRRGRARGTGNSAGAGDARGCGEGVRRLASDAFSRLDGQALAGPVLEPADHLLHGIIQLRELQSSPGPAIAP